jgi:predicted lysophospholipase L1 biosynthesis ABC-type transport system permease subunit
MEGRLRSLAIVPRPGREATVVIARVKEFLVRAAVMALVSDGAKVQLLSSMGAVSVSGTIDLLLPLLLAGLIVLNTMMGSVHERVREISIFSSVGLAPVHIAALFVAEAFVVAIVGVVLGYLLAQAVAAVLLSSGTLAGLSLNYSSSAAVGACIIVIVAVMLSTIYPARRASDLSVPDVTRRWALPKAEGDRLQFDFPFTVGQTDLVGLFTYLADLFRAYRDSSIGSFAADRVVQRRTAGGVVIEMDCWLAPYDLGISQRMVMEAIPMAVAGLYRVNLTLTRSSGEAGSWWRQNRRFLTTLRKRFLIWRMFGPELKARYAESGAARLAEAHV